MASRDASSMYQETMRKGPWLEEEDARLTAFVISMGERRWDFIARVSGLNRSGKSCRLRWLNYLRPDLNHGQITAEEECVILQLQQRWGNKWSKIARRLPGRTDNEVKNYWRTHLRKKTQAQEQEKLHREICTAISTPDDQSNQTNSSSECIGAGGMTDIENVYGSFDYGYVASPYERRIYDWISETIHDHQENNAWDRSSSSNPPTTSAAGEDWTGLLWDMQ